MLTTQSWCSHNIWCYVNKRCFHYFNKSFVKNHHPCWVINWRIANCRHRIIFNTGVLFYLNPLLVKRFYEFIRIFIFIVKLKYRQNHPHPLTFCIYRYLFPPETKSNSFIYYLTAPTLMFLTEQNLQKSSTAWSFSDNMLLRLSCYLLVSKLLDTNMCYRSLPVGSLQCVDP